MFLQVFTDQALGFIGVALEAFVTGEVVGESVFSFSGVARVGSKQLDRFGATVLLIEANTEIVDAI